MQQAKPEIRGLGIILFVLGCALLSVETALEGANQPQSSGAAPVQSLPLSGPDKWRLYNPKPDHIWNRLYRSLYLRRGQDGREYGYDELEVLLWPETKYLLHGPAYMQALSSLDEFLNSHAERLIPDPLKRAILQRDVWAVFDWTAARDDRSPESRDLQIKLGQVIHRLALSADQTRGLPDTYRDAVAAKAFAPEYDPERRETVFLPADLFLPNGPWVQISAGVVGPTAITHVYASSGRSVFRIFMRLPAGREATLAYLKKVGEFPRPWVPDKVDPEFARDPRRVLSNPELPQFPAGTQIALVRQMVLVDEQGNLVLTRITEDVQIRVHRETPGVVRAGRSLDSNEAVTALDTYEFKLSRTRLFAGEAGGLRPVARDEGEFPLFQSHGIDPFEGPAEPGPPERHLRPVLRSCAWCHFNPGIHSVLSRKAGGAIVATWNPEAEVASTKAWKHNKYDWGLLQGLWRLQPSSSSR